MPDLFFFRERRTRKERPLKGGPNYLYAKESDENGPEEREI